MNEEGIIMGMEPGLTIGGQPAAGVTAPDSVTYCLPPAATMP